MTILKKVVELPRDTFKDFDKWNEVRDIYLGSCHCTSITTDLEESIEVEALTEYCLEELCNNYVKLGFVIHVPHPRVSIMRPENETPNTE